MAYSKRHRNQLAFAPESLESRRVLATLSGTVYEDADNDQVIDISDPKLSGAVVYLDANNNGQLDRRGFGLDPDEFAPGQVLNNARQTVFSSATGDDNQPALRVLARDELSRATTGQRVFGMEDTTDWGIDRRLRFDFTVPVDSVSLDVVGSSAVSNPNVVLEAYDTDATLIESVGVDSLGNGQIRRLEIVRAQKDLSFVIARVTSTVGTVKYDNLRADDAGSERATLTSDSGFYRFTDVPSGLVTIAQVTPEGYDQTTPTTTHQADVTPDLVRTNLNFGNRTAKLGGIVYEDLGTPGPYDPQTDRALEGVGVYVDANRNGSPDVNTISIVPNVFLQDQVIEFVSRYVRLSTADADNRITGEKVVASTDAEVSPNAKVFTHENDASWATDVRWRADIVGFAGRVELTFIGADETAEVGRLVVFSSTGVPLDSVETMPLGRGESETLVIDREGFDISHVVAYTTLAADQSNGSLRLTNFRSQIVREPVATTNRFGEYSFKPLPGGDYQIRTLPDGGPEPIFPENHVQQVSIAIGETKDELDFGFAPVNLPPIAKNDFAQTQEDFVVAIGVLANDEDPEGSLDVQSIQITQQPGKGTAVVDASGFINYTPDPDAHGRDSLVYTVEDDQGAVSNSAVVTIQVDPVNDAPVAADDQVVVLGSNATSFYVLANDTDVDSSIDPSTLTIVSDPTNGTATVDPVTGVIVYTPVLAGASDSFTYRVEDREGLSSNVATVTLNRVTQGTPPVAVDDTTSTLEGTATQIAVTNNDTDADGTINLNSVFVVSLPGNGSVRVEQDGSVHYQPNLGFLGTDTFAYRVHDNTGLVSNAASVSVTMSERDFPYQNPINNLDVDGDGNISPRDVLLIIREIDDRNVSSAATGEVTTTPTPGTRPTGYFDVDGNGFVIGRDVLAVVIRLNELSAASAEPPESSLANDQATVATIFALQFDPFEEDDEEAEGTLDVVAAAVA